MGTRDPSPYTPVAAQTLAPTQIPCCRTPARHTANGPLTGFFPLWLSTTTVLQPVVRANQCNESLFLGRHPGTLHGAWGARGAAALSPPTGLLGRNGKEWQMCPHCPQILMVPTYVKGKNEP